jgi:hypothetical protein
LKPQRRRHRRVNDPHWKLAAQTLPAMEFIADKLARYNVTPFKKVAS